MLGVHRRDVGSAGAILPEIFWVSPNFLLPTGKNRAKITPDLKREVFAMTSSLFAAYFYFTFICFK